MKETLKKFAELEERKTEQRRDIIVLKVIAYCSDGEKREVTNYIEDQKVIEELMLDVCFNSLDNSTVRRSSSVTLFSTIIIESL